MVTKASCSQHEIWYSHSSEAVCHSVESRGFEAGLGFSSSHSSYHIGPVVWTSCFWNLGFLVVKWRYKYISQWVYMRINQIVLLKDRPTEEIQVLMVESRYGLTQSQDKLWFNSGHLCDLLVSLCWPNTEIPIAHFEEVILNAIMPYLFISEVFKTRN